MHRARRFVPSHVRPRTLRRRPVVTAVVAAAGLATAIWLPTRFDQASATENPVLRQVFADEFDGARGAAVDGSKWSTDGRSVRLDGQGHASLTAVAGFRRDVSAALRSRKTFTAPAGEVKARVKVADGDTVRSVFRLLGADAPDVDVMSNNGNRSAVVRGALGIGVDGSLDAGGSLAEGFHEYAVRWTTDGDIVWTLDQREYLRTERDLTEPFAVSLETSTSGGGFTRMARFGAGSRGTSMLIDSVQVSVEEPAAEEPPAEEEPSTPPSSTPPSSAPPSSAPPASTPPTEETPAATAWKPFVELKKGQLVTFGGKTYRVKEDHTSLPEWKPTEVPDLFEVV